MVSLLKLKDIQVSDWEAEVEKSEVPVVVEFWHQKCQVCEEMEPVVEQLPDKLGVKAKLVRVNVLDSKENRVFAIKLGVRSTPTFVVVCSGRPIGMLVGLRTLKQMVDELNMVLGLSESCLMATPLNGE